MGEWVIPVLRLVAAICLAAGAASPVLAQPVADVRGIEDSALRATVIAAIGDLTRAEADRLTARQRADTAAERARRVLRSEGYYGADVTARIVGGERPVIIVDAGSRFVIGEVSVAFEGEVGRENTALTTAMSAVTLQAGAPLRAADVIAADAAGLAALQTSGWPEAEEGERHVLVDHATGEGDITFRYEAGLFTRFGAILPRDDAWRDGYIASLSPLREGEAASLDAMRDYRRRLEALDSVAGAELILGEPGPDGETRDIDVQLTPAPRHAIEAALSYSTSDGAGATGRWTRRNLFGGDEALTLSATLATLKQSLGADIALPNWRRYGQRLTLGAAATLEDTDAFEQDEFSLTADLTREISNGAEIGLGLSGDLSRITDADGVRDIYTLEARAGLAQDVRDDPLDPHTGYRAAFELGPAWSFGDSDALYLHAEAEASGYYPVQENVVAAARVRFGSIIGAQAADLPADERFYAGGGGSARGFDYQSLSPVGANGEPFGGLSVVETSFELRWRSTARPRWGGVAFIDVAAASAGREPDFSDLRAAAGLGVRYYFDFAPVRLDIATPLDRRDGEDPIQFYISLGQAF